MDIDFIVFQFMKNSKIIKIPSGIMSYELFIINNKFNVIKFEMKHLLL